MRRELMSVALFATSLSFAQNSSHQLLRKPALSATSIVFSFAGDLWSVPRNGGEARRLTTSPGVESDPIFSPDGAQIAFSGEYDGNQDVFVVPVAGGVPKRLTWHPGPDFAVGWTPDGRRVLFGSTRASSNDGPKLFTVSTAGGLPEQVPLPIAVEASYSPDGSHLAYVPLFQWQEAWKRYRGGQTKKIWLADLSDSSIQPVPRENSNDFNPMWVGGKVYFLSDRNGPVSLFSYDPQTKEVKQLIENRGLDFKSASAGPGAIVYEQFGALFLYDLQSGESKPVNVHVAGDLPEVRTHFVNVSKHLTHAGISPNGARAIFEARGEIITVPAEKGNARNLTNSPGAADREPAWSPDGESIAYFSDESGEYELHVRKQNGMGEVKKIALADQPGFFYAPRWSPDSKKLAYLDTHLNLWYVGLDTQKPTKVDRDYYQNDDESMAAAWSPDSKWIAYTKQLKSHLSAIFLYSLATGKIVQVTDGMSDAQSPVFDKSGKYLFFTASTDSGESMEPDIHGFSRPVTRSVYLAVLSNGDPSPFAPESDDEKKAEAKKEESKNAPQVTVKIDFANIGQRILAVPIPARRYARLLLGGSGTLLAVEEPPPGPSPDRLLTVHRFDMAKRKADVPVGGVRQFQMSFNGEKMLYQQGDKWTIAPLKPIADGPPGPPAPPSGQDALKTEDIEVRVDPRAEWKQMYREVWRIQRDFFYDPNFHGLDLHAASEKYRPYVDDLGSRGDLNYLFSEMLGEMTVGHMFVGGGDRPEVKHVKTGLLGADYRIENGRYRFTRIYNGENWNPDLKAPLTQPGVNVAAGEYLLSVNGRDLRPNDDVYSLFEGTAGKATVLRVGPDPTGTGAREVIVEPVEDEHRLRNLAWIEDNRRKVDQLSHGRIAYIYMPETAYGGYTSFNRYFFAQVGKEAAIIDDRFNHGGKLATDIIEYLKRSVMSFATSRDGADWVQPQGAIYGPKVMIINEFAGSGGDAMPWYFRRAGIGKLIGNRTWGGLVGMSGVPELIDGGRVTAPSFAIWNPNGEFDVENHGVAPDIEVELDPASVRRGHDPQLETAVKVVMEELEKNPVRLPPHPRFPNYHSR
jgi:tricorn protease